MKEMNKTCNHIGLFSDDPQELIPFYEEMLGFERGETKLLPAEVTEKIFGINSRCSLIKLVFGRVVLEVFSLEDKELEKRPSVTKGYNHWGLAVKDRASFVSVLEKRGIPIIRVENRGRHVVFIRDPESNLIEIFEA